MGRRGNGRKMDKDRVSQDILEGHGSSRLNGRKFFRVEGLTESAFCECCAWGAEEIDKRQSEMAALALQAWPLRVW